MQQIAIEGQEPQPITIETTTPANLHQKASDYLNKPEGQLQDVMNTMHSTAERGNFDMTAHNLSSMTVKSLKAMGHDVQENAGGGHTISWRKKMA